MSVVYLARNGVERLAQMQEELYAHLVTDRGGRCDTCHEVEPCQRRNDLMAEMLAYGRLPRRRPGLTRAGLRDSR